MSSQTSSGGSPSKQPELAQRLEIVVDALRDDRDKPDGYVSSGEAAAALG